MRKTLQWCVPAGVLFLALLACKKKPAGGTDESSSTDELAPPKGGYLADIGFRPNQHGYPFRNTGGKFPRTPGLVNTNVMVKMFGKDACVNGNTKNCKLTPPANEWAGMINRAMNGGQCEGMAVSSLTFFKKIDDPNAIARGATSAHGLQHSQVAPLIGYYWAYQLVNPVMRETMNGRRRYTPVQMEDRLVQMMKAGELATIGFWAPPGQRGGHAVTPYAVEDKGNGVHWIRIYDNNYPDKERYITIDRNANTWKYDLAAINPGEVKRPWGGNAEMRSIVVIPLEARLKKAECPFCRGAGGNSVYPRGNALNVTDEEGRKLGFDEKGNVVNEIPDAEIVDVSAFLDGVDAVDPVYILPSDHDYEMSIGAKPPKPAGEAQPAAPEEGEDDDKGLTIFRDGKAIGVEKTDVKDKEKDTLSLSRDGSGIKYKSGNGKMPALKMAVDDEKGGFSVRIGNIKADADDDVEVKFDHKVGKLTVQGGGKATESYDIKMKHVHEDADDEEVEEKGVKFKLGDSHAIDMTPQKGKPAGVGGTGLRIARGKFVPKPKPAKDDKGEDKPGLRLGGDKDKPDAADKGAPKALPKPGLTGGSPAAPPPAAPPPAAPPAKPPVPKLKKP